jgi:copper chaperone
MGTLEGSKMTTLSLPDMSCGHCKAAVEAALGAVPGVTAVEVDLATHLATVSGSAEAPALLAAAKAAGYPATAEPA